MQSERLSAALRSAGADVELITYEGADHMWRGAPDVAEDALNRTITFLLEVHVTTADSLTAERLDTLLDAVLGQVQSTDPRVNELIGSLIRHAHAFVRGPPRPRPSG